MFRSLSALACILVVSLAATSCDSDDPVTPTEPEPIPVIEAFSGTLTVNGGNTHLFLVQRAGEASVRINALTPEDAVVGLSMGPVSGQACSQSLARDNATIGASIIGTASAGNFCVRLFDAAGTLTGPVDYEISVTHY